MHGVFRQLLALVIINMGTDEIEVLESYSQAHTLRVLRLEICVYKKLQCARINALRASYV